MFDDASKHRHEDGGTSEGTGDELVVIDGWKLRRNARLFGDSQPRILDIEAAQRVGLSRPRDIRKIIEPLAAPENLKDFGICAVTAQNHLGGRGRPTREYWLTETQLIIVIGRCATPTAFKIQCEVARVFVAWRHGRLEPAAEGVSADLVREIVAAAVAPLLGQIQRLERGAALNGRISTEDRCLIKALKFQISRKEVEAKRFASLRQANADIQRAMYGATGWGGKNEPLEMMPITFVGKAITCLRNRLDSVDRQLRSMKQTGFDFGGN